MKMAKTFPPYREFDPQVPVWCVTPGEGRVIHRFFDTSPFSPSGRYMALFRLPYEDRNPSPGDAGDVILVDLEEGTERTVYRTHGWEPQVGANVQWGASDNEVYFNDVDTQTWTAFAVKLNPFTLEHTRIDYGVFMVSPDGSQVATTCPLRARCTQLGYGVVVPDAFVPRNTNLRDDDGLYISSTRTGKCERLVSMRQIVETTLPRLDPAEYQDGEFYGFQCKWSPRGDRLLFVLRWIPTGTEWPARHGLQRANYLTMKADGTDIRVAVSAQRMKGGHHPAWCRDGENLTMNLNVDGDGVRFAQFRYDGTGLRKLAPKLEGSGHPTMHPNRKNLVTDSYTQDRVAFKDGTVPIRFIDIENGTESTLIRIRTGNDFGQTMRVDPHPAWNPTYTKLAFNGYADGTRRVYVADLSSRVGTGA